MSYILYYLSTAEIEIGCENIGIGIIYKYVYVHIWKID